MAKSKATGLARANKLLKIDDSKLDRYLFYYSGDLEREDTGSGLPVLTATEQDMLKKYERVYEMFDIGRTDAMIRSFLKNEYEIKDRQARYIIEEARIIYGITGKADKEGKKQASINYFRTLSNLAFKNKELELAGKLWEKADKLEGLFDAERLGLDPSQFLKPSKITFIDNLQIVNNNRLVYDE